MFVVYDSVLFIIESTRFQRIIVFTLIECLWQWILKKLHAEFCMFYKMVIEYSTELTVVCV